MSAAGKWVTRADLKNRIYELEVMVRELEREVVMRKAECDKLRAQRHDPSEWEMIDSPDVDPGK